MFLPRNDENAPSDTWAHDVGAREHESDGTLVNLELGQEVGVCLGEVFFFLAFGVEIQALRKCGTGNR